jgi:hypothetical protein
MLISSDPVSVVHSVRARSPKKEMALPRFTAAIERHKDANWWRRMGARSSWDNTEGFELSTMKLFIPTAVDDDDLPAGLGPNMKNVVGIPIYFKGVTDHSELGERSVRMVRWDPVKQWATYDRSLGYGNLSLSVTFTLGVKNARFNAPGAAMQGHLSPYDPTYVHERDRTYANRFDPNNLFLKVKVVLPVGHAITSEALVPSLYALVRDMQADIFNMYVPTVRGFFENGFALTSMPDDVKQLIQSGGVKYSAPWIYKQLEKRFSDFFFTELMTGSADPTVTSPPAAADQKYAREKANENAKDHLERVSLLQQEHFGMGHLIFDYDEGYIIAGEAGVQNARAILDREQQEQYWPLFFPQPPPPKEKKPSKKRTRKEEADAQAQKIRSALRVTNGDVHAAAALLRRMQL